MTNYVIGFAFTGNSVVLIKKNRPEWQAGKLNGIGGKIEIHELPERTMVREFQEEAGVWVDHWKKRGVMIFDHTNVYVFSTLLNVREKAELRSLTDEPIGLYLIDSLPPNVIPNLRWIIPYCFHEPYLNKRFTIFDGDIAR